MENGLISVKGGSVCIATNFTGAGHIHRDKLTKKKGINCMGDVALCLIQIQATSIAQLIPPKNPNTLLYKPLLVAHTLTAFNTS